MNWHEEIVTIQFRVPRFFKIAFEEWCEDQGCTMSAALVSFIVQRDKIGLPRSLKKPWKKTDTSLGNETESLPTRATGEPLQQTQAEGYSLPTNSLNGDSER
jgi:hypothetical protein